VAKQKQEEAPKGSPAWMATFSDLMNLLLCFFVLLFSMANVEEEKFQEVVASLQNSFSILPSGGSSIGEGQMISSGISALEMFDDYFKSVTDGEDDEFEHQGGEGNIDGQDVNPNNASGMSQEEIKESYEEAELSDSEQMAEKVEAALAAAGLQDQVEVDFNAQYVLITLNGAVLFDSGSAELKSDAVPMMEKIAVILGQYTNNIIEVEGHTDNVPMSSARYENNDVLSMYRALYVADFIRDNTTLELSHIKSSGRGEYVPVADNGTAEGRARNRRVEIKIFNSYNSDDAL